jgi:hypothetical protein
MRMAHRVRSGLWGAAGLLLVLSGPGLAGATRTAPARDLTVKRPLEPPPMPPEVPPPVSVTPGYPLAPFQASLLDETTRFLTSGAAQQRCPGQPVLFISGVVDPNRPTRPGDGVFMCRSDAVAEGFVGP